MIAQGRLRELAIFLGWLMHMRQFTINLPMEKWLAWSDNIEEMPRTNKTSLGNPRTLVDQLKHVCFTIPDAQAFYKQPLPHGKVSKEV